MLVLDVLVDNKEQEVFVFSCSQSDMITCSFVATCIFDIQAMFDMSSSKTKHPWYL